LLTIGGSALEFLMDDGGVPQLIRACGDVLALPARVIATALVFFHRFKSSTEVERVAAIADGAVRQRQDGLASHV
jgi:hypothetical protein